MSDDPYRRHRFDVDIGDDRPPLGFTEVRGLTVRVQARPDEETENDDAGADWLDWRDRFGAVGRVPPIPRRRTASPPLTLRRGITDDRRLWDWLRDWVDGRVEKRDVRVYLLDAAGERARGWRCRDATPARWTGPELAADRPAAATETLELVHEGLDAIAGEE
jgi:phage tail-like protein